jgi:hypothetical protein
MQSNLNYQKDLNEVAVIVAQKLAGRENEIGEGMAKVYANEFSEQELKDLVTFYKSPLGQKLLSTEPRAIQFSMSYMNQWAQVFAEAVNGEFRAEMRKRAYQGAIRIPRIGSICRRRENEARPAPNRTTLDTRG